MGVELVAVHPDHQRRGVGTKLLAWVEQQGLELLMDRFPEELRSNGSRLLLEVRLSLCVSLFDGSDNWYRLNHRLRQPRNHHQPSPALNFLRCPLCAPDAGWRRERGRNRPV